MRSPPDAKVLDKIAKLHLAFFKASKVLIKQVEEGTNMKKEVVPTFKRVMEKLSEEKVQRALSEAPR